MANRTKRPLVAERRAKPDADRPKRTRRPRRTARKRGPLARLAYWTVGLFWRVGWRLAVLALVVLGGFVGYTALTIPPQDQLLDARARGSVTLLDRDGEVFAWRGEQFGGRITADTVSPHLRNAIVATEDRRFYSHLGVDPRGILGAIRINLSEGRTAFSGHGGSTITQQTAKLLCLGVPYDPESGMTEAEYEADCREGSIARKAKEAIYALALETRYTKDEILTIYLNRAYLGAGSRGFEAAAQRYFGKSANEVEPAEAAMLAGLLVAPSRFAPTANLERSQNRAATIVRLMRDQDYLTADEAEAALANPARLSAAAERKAGGYYADWVMDQGPSFLTSETTEDVLIRTTFDQRIQDAAEGALETIFETKVKPGSKAQAAIVVMSADGAVRAMVGGRAFTDVAGSFNRAIQAKRQTGSAFKPFVYAAALDLGYAPRDTVVDDPLTIDIPGSGPWTPQNYDRTFHGRVSLAEALAQSLNIPAVKVSEFVGRDAVRAVANGFGIESDLADGPALALGASESTLLEMTAAYAGILNGGSAVEPYGLIDLTLKGESASLIDQAGGIGERVISETAARELIWMMTQVIDHGTGTRAQLPGGWQAAGKTGTTSAQRDAWFLGFTADYVAGVWMGYDDNTPLTGVTGGGLPAEIWQEVMARVHTDEPPKPLPMIVPDRPIPQAERAPQAQAPVPQRGGGGGSNGGGGFEEVAEDIVNDVLRSIFGR